MENLADKSPVLSPKISKARYWVVSTGIIFLAALIFGFASTRTAPPAPTDKPQKTADQTEDTPAPNLLTVTGILRHSGLSLGEQKKLGLSGVEYQITDFTSAEKTQDQIQGYFLISQEIDLKLWGKCVRGQGTVPEEWKRKNKADSYNRLALQLFGIEKMAYADCRPYPEQAPAIDNSQEKIKLRGFIAHQKRPSPDIGIGSDYWLVLSEEPFVDKYSSSGLTPPPQNTVYLNPSDNSIWQNMEENIGKVVDIEGHMTWGYSESRYLQVVDLRRLTLNTTQKESPPREE